MKKIKNNKKKNSSTHNFGVIVEHFESKLDLVVEGNQMIDKKVDDLKTDMDERFTAVDQKFDIVHEQFDIVHEQFSAVFDELHLIRNDLKEKVSRDEFIVLEKRVMALEKKANQK